MGGNEESEDTFSGVHLMTDLLLDCKGSQFKSPPSLFHAKPLKLSNLIFFTLIITAAVTKADAGAITGATVTNYASRLQLKHLHLRFLEFLFSFHNFENLKGLIMLLKLKNFCCSVILLIRPS